MVRLDEFIYFYLYFISASRSFQYIKCQSRTFRTTAFCEQSAIETERKKERLREPDMIESQCSLSLITVTTELNNMSNREPLSNQPTTMKSSSHWKWMNGFQCGKWIKWTHFQWHENCLSANNNEWHTDRYPWPNRLCGEGFAQYYYYSLADTLTN